MINNYFFLSRFVKELRTKLIGLRLENAFSQEKDKLLLSFSNTNEQYFLDFHAGFQLPYLQSRASFQRAKKNTRSFFEQWYHQKLLSIQIAKFERVIRFRFENFYLFLLFRGKDSNALLISDNGATEVFKDYIAETLSSIVQQLNEIEFADSFAFSNELPSTAGIQEFKQTFPFFGKKLLAEIVLRTANAEKNFNDIVADILFEVATKKLRLCLNKETKEFSLLPDSFFTANNLEEIKSFDTCASAVHELLIAQTQFHLFQSLYKQADKFLETEYKRTAAKYEAIKLRMSEGSKENIYTESANLLLINLHKATKGMNKITFENIYQGGTATILLNDKLSPNENVNHYFNKAKSEKYFFTRAATEIEQLSKKLEQVAAKQKILSAISSLEELKQFTKALQLKTDTQSHELPKITFKQYLIDGVYKVYVGKNSKNNDLLTTKFAKQNDFWFHARSVSGSHVVLRVENTKGAIPKPVLKKAAQLAAFYSKAKTAGVAPVSYALKKFVVKRKGMEAGMVSLLREDTLLVKPEIPQGCELLSEENIFQ